jgi:predicted DNA-binding transcriptional regulator AlpA
MNTRYIRFKDLQAAGVVNNRVTLSRWIQKHGFPAGVLIGPNTRAWPEQEVEAWLKSRPVTTDPVCSNPTGGSA